jgi:hypothetical protein
MKKRMWVAVAAILTVLATAGILVPSLASSSLFLPITKGVTVRLNGAVLELKDANGAPVEAFLNNENGTV